MSRKCPKRNHPFLNWLHANRTRFPFEPRVLASDRLSVRGHFANVNPAIRFSFSRCGCVVSVRWKARCWDVLGDFDVAERRSDKGFYSAFLLPERIIYHPNREALWVEESFEPFLTWCHKVLAESPWLAIYECEGCTEARLLRDERADPNRKNRQALLNLGSLQIAGLRKS